MMVKNRSKATATTAVLIAVAFVVPSAVGYLTTHGTTHQKRIPSTQHSNSNNKAFQISALHRPVAACSSTASSSSVHHVTRSITADDQSSIGKDDDDVVERLERLWSYVNNLQIARKVGNLKPARSLAHYLRENPLLSFSKANTATGEQALVEACERALTQAFRIAGQNGDYRLVLQLVDSSILYANDHPILTSRIFGEALGAMTVTGANISKLKYIWNLVANGTAPFLHTPLSAFELNTMIKALADRGKVGACVDVYRRHTTTATTTTANNDEWGADNDTAATTTSMIRPDAYTASALFAVLTNSINVGQFEKFSSFPLSESASPFEKSLKKLTNSPCWQWNTAVELLHTLENDGGGRSRWNNHAYSALLKLHDKAQESFPNRHENGPRIALAILDSMIKSSIPPDVVTCSLAIKAMGDPYSDPLSWKLAVAFFERMKLDKRLPDPNHYIYSAVIVACARCKEYEKALELLDELRTMSSGNTNKVGGADERLNTWVYNAAFLAIGNVDNNTKKRREASRGRTLEPPKPVKKRHLLALELLEQMKEDHTVRGFDTKPDTVTYNTIFSIFGAARDELESGGEEEYDEWLLTLIQQMHDDGVVRDSKTYRNAILSASSSATVLRILDTCLEDLACQMDTGKKSRKATTRGMTDVFNSALEVLGSRGNTKLFKEVYTIMHDNSIPKDGETTASVINFLGQSGQSTFLLQFIKALNGNNEHSDTARREFEEHVGLPLQQQPLPPLAAGHPSLAITVCLLVDDLATAHSILSSMRENGIKPTISCLEEFSIAYARAAITAAAKETKQKRTQKPGTEISKSRAKSAYSITLALKNPPFRVLLTVVKACAATDQWSEAQAILRVLHNVTLGQDLQVGTKKGETERLQALHTSLLRQCANRRNVNAALWFVDDIQHFAQQYRARMVGSATNSTREALSIHSTHNVREVWKTYKAAGGDSSDISTRVGMRAEDWVSLVKAASESGHWRVCVNTMQFLRPYVERTNPDSTEEMDSAKSDIHYAQLTPALTAAAHCLEQRSQYAWARKIVEDWMDWSGRKVRPDAVLAVIRILSAQGLGEEVKTLLTRCIQQGAPTDYSKDELSYEELLYIGTVTALHNNGLYDDADEVMVSGISQGLLPFAVEHRNDRVELDLHGLNVALAHSTVRLAMRQQVATANDSPPSDMMLITGRGRNSALRLRPVLRPEVQRMLLEEFYPPLNTISAPGNLGALLVFADDISAWQSHQQEQKGARMLVVADILKNLSTERLRRSIALTLKGQQEDTGSSQ